MASIYPVLLAGGSGTRLWPLSRKSYPKQFSNFIGNKTLFQQSALRMITSDRVKFSSQITVTNSDFRFIVGEQLQEVGIDPGHILIEPEAKNTASAILAASIYSYSKEENAILLVSPSDHQMPDKENFHDVINIGLAQVNKGKLITFGIRPTHPETGFGYLQISSDDIEKYGISRVLTFIEKPNRERAEEMLKTGDYLWNAGIFLFKAIDMIKAFQIYAPKTFKLVSNAINSATVDLGFLRLDSESWSQLEDISIDYAIMEKAQNLVSVPYSSKWSDLGGWDAVWSESAKDATGNVTSERAYVVDCKNTLLRSETEGQQVVGLGLENIMAIAMADAVLVANKNEAQNVKKAVDLLKLNKIPQADIFPKDHRPWGWFESLAMGNQFQVKRICVKPGASLSLQSHKYRSEHWVVVEGTVKVTINDKVKFLSEGQSVYVPLNAIHRMENTGKLPMVLIEVQTGTYLGEDDIIRYEDIYSRGQGAKG